MAFNCVANTNGDASSFNRDRSQFGDAYSVHTRDDSYVTRYVDEPERDYDEGGTELYRCIEEKDWDGALSHLEAEPMDAKTWVYRREPNTDRIRWRLLPLHAVCIFRAPLALMEALIEVYPEGAKMKDDQGMLPVHLACRNGASKGVVLTLLSVYPESIHIRDRKKRSPMDLVSNSGSTNKESVIQAMKKFVKEVDDGRNEDLPTATTGLSVHTGHSSKSTEVDYENRTLLFRMILKKEWKQATSRAKSFPEEAGTWIVTKGFNGNLRFLPLHKACVLKPPAEFIETLVKAFPESVAAKDQDGWLPIHCACFYGGDNKVINILLNADPRGAHCKDDEGRLPIHYACLKGASKDVVDVLLLTHAKGALCKDDEGRLPIHHACSKGAPEAIIDALLKAAPKGAQTKDDQGRLPLHLACRKNASERVIRTLLRVYPRAAQIKDDQEKLAIHYACQHGATPAIVSFLLTTYPESIFVKNGFGYTPVAEAKALEDPKMDPVIKILDKFKREQEKKGIHVDDSNVLREKVETLENRVQHLHKSMKEIAEVGKELRSDLRKNKDAESVLEKLAEKLIDFGKVSKTPLNARQSTPSKGLFGRKKSVPAN